MGIAAARERRLVGFQQVRRTRVRERELPPTLSEATDYSHATFSFRRFIIVFIVV